MERVSCRFAKDAGTRHVSTHPLHLCSDVVKWLSAFGKCDSPCIASIIRRSDAYQSYNGQLFVVVQLDHFPKTSFETEEVESSLEEPIVLRASREFLCHYGISEGDESLVVGLARVFPLSRVILSATSQDSFTWANSLSFERGLMVTGSSQKKLLARQGDWFLGQPEKIFDDNHQMLLNHFRNLTVLESYPVKQGYIHSNTEVVIALDNKGMTEKNDRKTRQDVDMVVLKDHRPNSRLPHDFDIGCEILCCSELALHLGITDQQIVSIEAFASSTRKVASSLEPENESDTSEGSEGYFVIDKPSSAIEVTEESSRIFVVGRIRVSMSETRASLNHSCQILHPSTLYVGHSLLFNCIGEEKYVNISSDIHLRVDMVRQIEVPFAKEVHLSLVRSPEYSPGSQFDQTLLKYLKTARILKVGDIIAIDTTNSVEFLCETDLKDASCKTLYYEVSRFGDDDDTAITTHFQVDIKHTVLFQDGSTNGYIPRSSLNHMAIRGMQGYVEELNGLISPYLRREIASVCTIMISGPPGCGKKSVVSSTASLLGLHVLTVSCHELMSDTSGATEAKIANAIKRAAVYAPCILLLNGIECLGKDNESGKADHRVCSALQQNVDSLINEEYPVVVVAVTSYLSSVVSRLRSQFLHKVEMRSLTETERQQTLESLSELACCGVDVNTQWIAKHTVGFTYGEFWALLRMAVSHAIERVRKECAVGSKLTWFDEMSICAAGIACQQCDFVDALKEMQSQRADIIGIPKIPDVRWEDIGGLEDVKETIRDTIQLPLEHPELVAAGLRRSGILLYGPPGTGKTLLAKAVATQCSLSFLSVKGPELINMYVGQSEENVRKVFTRARDAAPCVVFFDELDSLAPNRGKSGDSGGVMDRVVSQLLAELDGLVEGDTEKQIFVIGASNRPDLIDPALLRPGRFDKLLYVGINEDKHDQVKILEAQTRRANLSTDVRLDEIIEQCPSNMTGADFYALTSAAMMNAIRRRVEILEKEEQDLSTESLKPLVVDQDDFLSAARVISPSVSSSEILRYRQIKNSIVAK